jgi:hypothetical protein
VIERPCRTILALIFTNLSRGIVIDQRLISPGSAGVRKKLARS